MEIKKAGAKSISDKGFDIVNYIFLGLIFLIVIYPLFYILIASVSNPYDVYVGKTFLLPSGFTLEGYKRIFSEKMISKGYLNSIVYTGLGTFISTVLVIITAYPLSRPTLPGKKIIMIFYVITMYFGGGLIPTYLVVSKLHMINSLWALILPGGVAVYSVIISRTFFTHSIPESLYDAAAIDGSSNMRTFLKIVLPLSKPLIAVMAIYAMVAYWNDWFTALIYLPSSYKAPLQLVLRQILIESQALANMMSGMDGGYAEANRITELIKFTSIVVASAPMLIIYPFVQKYFDKGMTIGAVKG
ncbi:MAG TPA: carbohydrate ABC transporter permease [Mobilitalea sp.]|nr:carbohydrate ABC transporter permease [Mobilitalea sp.]